MLKIIDKAAWQIDNGMSDIHDVISTFIPSAGNKLPNIAPKVNEIVDVLIKKISPQKLLMFGSRARGDEQDDSDLDLCVIVGENSHTAAGGRFEIAVSANEAISNVATMPVDIVVCEENNFNERAKFIGTIEHIIAREGVLLYESA